VARKLALASLFETRWRLDLGPAPYPTLRAHLDAARDGTKPLSAFGFRVADVTRRDRDYLTLLEQALRRGLVVTLLGRPQRDIPFVRQDLGVFVARPEELWRIPAWVALWHARASGTRGRNDAVEALESQLLGYTPAQRARWLASLRQRAPAHGRAVYALLSRTERARAAALGMRCLGSPSELAGMQLFVERDDFGVRRDAFRRIPAGLALARLGVPDRTLRAIFNGEERSRRRRVIAARLTRRAAAALNASLRDDVELLTARGWR
jgi:hypothetical protein